MKLWLQAIVSHPIWVYLYPLEELQTLLNTEPSLQLLKGPAYIKDTWTLNTKGNVGQMQKYSMYPIFYS